MRNRAAGDRKSGMKTMVSFLLGTLALTACISRPPEEIRVSGNRIFMPISINGEPAEALMDSGAEMTLVDAAFADRLGLAGAGTDRAKGTGAAEIEVLFAQGVSLEAAGNRMDDQAIAIVDLGDIANRVVGEPVTIIMGRELFDAGRYYLDIEASRFHQVPDDFQPRGTLVNLSDANGIKQIPVSFNGAAPVQADFDLGNGSEILLSEEFAQTVGLLTADRILGIKQGGGLGGPVERTLVRIDSLSIAGVEMHDLIAAVAPSADGADANVGASLLRDFIMVIDFPGNRLWLEPRP
jgi:predicted aspartyl protease